MHLLVAYLFVFCLFGSVHANNHRLIVFTHDGTFYKLDPETELVQWHNELPFKLLSLEIAPRKQMQNQSQKIFIPTIDGDFVYLQHSIFDKHPKEILVPREDVEHLLDMCFEENLQQKYFVYQKTEYFVLNTQNGQFFHLEQYLNDRLIFDPNVHSIIVVSKKLLKQMSRKLEVKWSVISSKISLLSIDQFVKNSKLNQKYTENPLYQFIRIDSKTIQIRNQENNKIFQIQASSSIINIFWQDKVNNRFNKIIIKANKNKVLALSELKQKQQKNQHSHMMKKFVQQSNESYEHFPHSSQIQKKSQGFNQLEICLKGHKLLKQQSGSGHLINRKFSTIYHDQQAINIQIPELKYYFQQQFDPKKLPTLPYSSDRRIHVIITKEQPYVYIFIIFVLVGGGILFYRLKVNKLWQQINQIQNASGENLKKVIAKLGEYESVGKQLKKMYEINWQKIIHKSKNYYIFEGRFLSQVAEVFMIPLKDGFDVIDVQHKLNTLINASHKYLIKLYYYTKSQDALLIFCESSNQFRRLDCQFNPTAAGKKLLQLNTNTNNEENNKMQPGLSEQNIIKILDKISQSQQSYKLLISMLMSTIAQLIQMKLQISSFSHQSLLLSQRLEIKINIIPSFFIKNQQMEVQNQKLIKIGTNRFRLDIIKAIHKMGHKGQQFDLLVFQKQKNDSEDDKAFIADFYDHFLLTENNQDDLTAIRNSQKHPYLWGSKEKMLYICDFSNYMETCVDEYKISRMESHCKNFRVVPEPWNTVLHPSLAKEINNYRKYDFYSVRDLIRLVRNKISHFHQIPKQTRLNIGKSPQQFVQYISQKYPKLLPFMYVYANKKKWKLNTHK